MDRFRWFSAILVLLISCGKGVPEIAGFDSKIWSNDKNACNGDRAKMVSALQANKPKLLGLTEMEVAELLGKPDQNELYKRNQKFFYYYFQPSPDCPNVSSNSSSRMVIRFNAMGLAKEVEFE